MHGVKSAKLAISKVALLTPCMEFENFCGYIPSFEVPLLDFFHNVSQSLPNPEFVSILDKKAIFSKGHPYSISILVNFKLRYNQNNQI